MKKENRVTLVFCQNGEPYTTSEVIADVAGMNRRTVNKLIKTYEKDLKELGKVRFEIAPLQGSRTGQNITVYHLNEQQATLLMTYARNTETVRAFKKELVKQFYAMRSLLLECNSPIWQDTRTLTKETRRIETDTIKSFVEYAKGQGSRNAVWYYTSISQLANKAARITDRDMAHVEQLAALMLIERVISDEIRAGMEAGKHYKQIYASLQARLNGVNTLICPQERAQACLTSGEYTDTTEKQNATESFKAEIKRMLDACPADDISVELAQFMTEGE